MLRDDRSPITQEKIFSELAAAKELTVRELLYSAIKNNDLKGMQLLLGHPLTAHQAADEVCRGFGSHGASFGIVAHIQDAIARDERNRMADAASIKKEILAAMELVIVPHRTLCALLQEGLGEASYIPG